MVFLMLEIYSHANVGCTANPFRLAQDFDSYPRLEIYNHPLACNECRHHDAMYWDPACGLDEVIPVLKDHHDERRSP